MIRGRFLWYLLATMCSAGTGFVVLPWVTVRLGPAEYGLYALIMSAYLIPQAVAGMGSSLILGESYRRADRAVKGSLAGTLICNALVISLVAGGLAWLTVSFLAEDRVAPGLALLGWIATVGVAPWLIALDIFTLDERAATYALVVFVRSAVWATTLLITTFSSIDSVYPLFLANAAAATAQGLLALVLVMMVAPLRFRVRHLGDVFRLGPRAGVAGWLEGACGTVERTLLAAVGSVATLGLYSHSQQYRSMLALGIKAVTRAVWPVTLDEAGGDGRFGITSRTWRWVHLGLIGGGLIIAALGGPLIDLLTNDKFGDAAPLVLAWVGLVLLLNTGRPHVAVLIKRGFGNRYSNCQIMGSAVGLAAAAVLIPAFGLPGAVVSAFLPALVQRIAITLAARRIQSIPFQDGVALVGLLVLAVALALTLLTDLMPIHRIIGTTLGAAVVAVALGGLFVGRKVA